MNSTLRLIECSTSEQLSPQLIKGTRSPKPFDRILFLSIPFSTRYSKVELALL